MWIGKPSGGFHNGPEAQCMTPSGISKIEQGSVRLPSEVIAHLPVSEGVSVLVQISAEGVITLKPIDPEQAWYWTQAWQAGEREADEDIRTGRVTRSNSTEEFLKSLDELD
jgi:antitoxin PrlF